MYWSCGQWVNWNVFQFRLLCLLDYEFNKWHTACMEKVIKVEIKYFIDSNSESQATLLKQQSVTSAFPSLHEVIYLIHDGVYIFRPPAGGYSTKWKLGCFTRGKCPSFMHWNSLSRWSRQRVVNSTIINNKKIKKLASLTPIL
ncbi:hypothetical protein T12_15167 [Trichinella patagoniensis]|uniref:Uncharacterized protein n=1 Tax=Trichinella patagoniensis TaxID=990121 RepID=A0A0V1AAR1_9BILA|nr:hypothetical protein T12_15167 [Trichinella patagoniensis]